MNSRKLIILVATLIMTMSAAAFAQTDAFGKTDTVFIETYQIDDENWGVNVSLFNDEEIMAMSIPLVFSSGKIKVIADSTVYKGGIVEQFRVKQSRVDTINQCLTIGLINDIGVSVPPIQPGKGRIATIFVSAVDGSKLDMLKVDTTTTPPGNNLQLVHPPSVGITPALVMIAGEKAKAGK